MLLVGSRGPTARGKHGYFFRVFLRQRRVGTRDEGHDQVVHALLLAPKKKQLHLFYSRFSPLDENAV